MLDDHSHGEERENKTWISVNRTHILTIQPFELWAVRSRGISVLSKLIHLSRCVVRKLLVTPLPIERQPTDRVPGVVRCEHFGLHIVTVHECAQREIPQDAPFGKIYEEPGRQVKTGDH